MTATTPPCLRIPGRARAFSAFVVGGAHSLWLAPDHLLHLRTTTWVEEGKRFDLRDVQAIAIVPNRMQLLYTVLCAAAIAAALIPAALAIAGAGGSGVYEGVVAGLAFALAPVGLYAAIALIVNLFAGPTCAVYLDTAVQRERLYAQGRMRSAQAFLELVEPAIRRAQETP